MTFIPWGEVAPGDAQVTAGAGQGGPDGPELLFSELTLWHLDGNQRELVKREA